MSGNSNSPVMSADVLITGGGVIGLTIARSLAHRGVSNVTLIEKNGLGREASWAAGGILAPQVEANRDDDFFQLACASRDIYRRFAAELKAESGVDIELDTSGTIYVGFTEEDETELQRRFAWQQSAGLKVDWLNRDEVCRLEPGLSDNVRCALLFPHDYQVNNRKLIDALALANHQLGVCLVTECTATGLRSDGANIAGTETSDGFIAARTVVLAAGAWSSAITSPANLPRPDVIPVRGQMLCFQAPLNFARHVIYSPRGYLIPRRDGRVLAGSTTEDVGFDKSVTSSGRHAMQSMALEIAPKLAEFPVTDSWAGFRPRTSDGLPVIGPTEQIGGLFYATGHYRNGILLAPITGELIAEAIASREYSRFLAAFSPDRFLPKANVGQDSETCASHQLLTST